MALVKARHRRRAKAFLAAAVLALAVLFILPLWARYLLVLPAAAAVLCLPLLTRGGRSALRQARWTSRERRIEQRKSYTDPVTGAQVRPKRPAVEGWVRAVVYYADRHRCVYCHRGPNRRGSKWAEIALDHIKPYSLGFNATVWNSATLCQQHNLVKSSYYKTDSGKILYRPFKHAADMGLAGEIARREMRVRLYPWRIARMAIAYWLRRGR